MRQIDVSRQKLSPHCLEAIFDSQLPSPTLSPKMPPKLSISPTLSREGFLSSFKINPAVRVIARQVRDKNCLAAIFAPRHQSVSSGPLGVRTVPSPNRNRTEPNRGHPETMKWSILVHAGLPTGWGHSCGEAGQKLDVQQSEAAIIRTTISKKWPTLMDNQFAINSC